MEGSVRQPSIEELVAIVARLQGDLAGLRIENQRLKTENTQLRERIAELEKTNPTKRLSQRYSLKAEEKRRVDAETAPTSGAEKKHGSSGNH